MRFPTSPRGLGDDDTAPRKKVYTAAAAPKIVLTYPIYQAFTSTLLPVSNIEAYFTTFHAPKRTK